MLQHARFPILHLQGNSAPPLHYTVRWFATVCVCRNDFDMPADASAHAPVLRNEVLRSAEAARWWAASDLQELQAAHKAVQVGPNAIVSLLFSFLLFCVSANAGDSRKGLQRDRRIMAGWHRLGQRDSRP
jgi:hypothetical protein